MDVFNFFILKFNLICLIEVQQMNILCLSSSEILGFLTVRNTTFY